MRLAVVGSRGFNNKDLLYQKLDELHPSNIISGGALGADSLARDYALENKIPLIEILPQWHKYGKPAGFIRNQKIIQNCDKCIAFWNGLSKGTENDISLCKKYKKPCYIIQYQDDNQDTYIQSMFDFQESSIESLINSCFESN